MNKNVEKLYRLSGKASRTIIGLMSGTSLDGLDIAHCTITGFGRDTNLRLDHFKTVPYSSEIKEEIRGVFAKKMVDLEQLTLLNPWLAILHGKWILEALEEWGISPSAVDLIASHGQTIFHAPKIYHDRTQYDNGTLQIGDGDHVARTTGIITISDFRQKHIAAGGEGAPLALYGDYLLFSKQGESRLLLNMGGIANFTFLPTSQDAEQVLVTDTGPGNTMIDAFAQHHFGIPFDKDAALALQGKVHDALLTELKSDPFFKLSIPKTTGPELFNLEYLRRAREKSGTGSANPHDILATLTHFSANTISMAIEEVLNREPIDAIFTSGGGAHNPLLMDLISRTFPTIRVATTDELNISGDAKEAVLFAVLANEAVAGGPIRFGERKGIPAVTMGKISFPD
ncbi:MAG: anhydro-N-acetylmuramic acid kinase [Chitinophagaceae bacterium]|nr:anhydro-N-acetylmuramic acid kinase [Chitinophagaceae bacterium]